MPSPARLVQTAETIMVQIGSARRESAWTMTGGQVFTSRLMGRPLLDGEGLTIGRIRDVVILPPREMTRRARWGWW